MANENNLKPIRSTSEARERGKKGGIASGKARREKKTVQKLLEDYLDSDIKSKKKLKDFAKAVGLKGDQSVKELITAVCILNTLKKGDVETLKTLCELLGEDNSIAELEDLTEVEGDIFGEN